MTRRLPKLVCHADWSVSADKRWLCVASLGDSGYRIEPPVPVGELAGLPSRLLQRAGDSPVLLGIDCPVGIPLAYARQAGIDTFASWLMQLGTGDWQDFFQIAASPEDISLYRPFYPSRPGGTSQAQLYGPLGLSSMNELLRRCDRKTDERNAASPLFWTLGAKQVGRAAISAWQNLLLPALRANAPTVRLWPFAGALNTLLAGPALVIAETYPAESGLHIGLPASGRGWSKNRQSDRVLRGAEILAWGHRREVTFAEAIVESIEDGFGPERSGEDPFDSLVGVAGMLEVVMGHRPEMPQLAAEELQVEGWIFGQA